MYDIIFDMDDTLLNSRRQISDFTLETMHRLQQLGHRIIINTARSQQYNQQYFDTLRPDYAILNGGALILNSREEPIYRAYMEGPILQSFLAKLLTVTDNFSVQTDRGLFTNSPTYTGQNAVYLDFANTEFTDPASKIVASVPDDEAAWSLAKEFNLQCTSYFGGDFKRFNHIDATKAQGNRKLMSLLGRDLSKVIAFGDDYGDLEMLRQAGVGVLMKNAKENLHSQVRTLSQHTNDEDGVARFLLDFFNL